MTGLQLLLLQVVLATAAMFFGWLGTTARFLHKWWPHALMWAAIIAVWAVWFRILGVL